VVAISNGYRLTATQQPLRRFNLEQNLAGEIDQLQTKLDAALRELAAAREHARKAEAEALTFRRIVEKHYRPDSATPKAVLAVVATLFAVTQADIVGTSRLRVYVRPRQMAMLLMRRYCPECRNSLPAIAEQFGGRDHTTVMHGINSARRRAKITPEYGAKLTEAEALLLGGVGNG
jgi:chromosomal replication initiator protein